mmetsp:Transcript_90709/g.211021  ORF Transcript_90709/g.211021 Transcript_90709/m.211021 type:complete len:245 (+) Transcript_90709:305-1039(+)
MSNAVSPTSTPYCSSRVHVRSVRKHSARSRGTRLFSAASTAPTSMAKISRRITSLKGCFDAGHESHSSVTSADISPGNAYPWSMGTSADTLPPCSLTRMLPEWRSVLYSRMSSAARRCTWSTGKRLGPKSSDVQSCCANSWKLPTLSLIVWKSEWRSSVAEWNTEFAMQTRAVGQTPARNSGLLAWSSKNATNSLIAASPTRTPSLSPLPLPSPAWTFGLFGPSGSSSRGLKTAIERPWRSLTK